MMSAIPRSNAAVQRRACRLVVGCGQVDVGLHAESHTLFHAHFRVAAFFNLPGVDG